MTNFAAAAEYKVRRLSEGRTHYMDINAAQFSHLRTALNILNSHLGIERRFDIALENYIEFEVVVHRMAVTHALRLGRAFKTEDETFSLVDRALTNLLSAGKGYRDEAARYRIAGKRSTLKGFFETRRIESIALRAIDELRNYAQHFSLPTHGISFSERWVEKEGIKMRRHELVPKLRVSELAKGVRESLILDELRVIALGSDEVEILPLIRGYIEDLASVHQQIRDCHRSTEEEAKRSILEMRTSIGREQTSEKDFVMAYSVDQNGNVIEEIYTGHEAELTLDYLRTKNPVPLKNFGLVEFSQ